MPITFKKDRVVFSDMASGEDAERLLEWLQKHPKGKIDLSECTHLQPANLQVLMAAKRSILAMPQDRLLADWLSSALQSI
ncbi:MAG TPA: hypothetical protein DDY32_02760 [Desulfobulbaceae bacterium]|nr:hypothetical protein [Desulfobulbaceae bacterium]